MVGPLSLGADLQSKIDQLISKSAALSGAFVGFRILNLKTGRVLYNLNSDRLFVPASNMKLFTSALALARLGPDYRFSTQIQADRPIDASGTLDGDLFLVGGGDPSLSARPYPYQYTPGTAPTANYSLRAIDELADQLVSLGLKRVDGNIVGDDRRYVFEPHPGVWQVGDALSEDGAPISALFIDDNSFALTLRPAATRGSLAQISLAPALEYFSIENRLRTEAGVKTKIEIQRAPGSHELLIQGVLATSDPGFTEVLAVDDPAQYAAIVLRDALERRGVVIHGQAAALHRFSDQDNESSGNSSTGRKIVFAERTSPPLAELLQVVDKVSQNLHAEILLREAGLRKTGIGSRESGLAELQAFLNNEAGIPKSSYVFTDGSGLSRSSLVTPAAIVRLLAYMYRSSYRDLWISLLPIAGADGTLANRFENHPEARAIHAKTGTLGHVRALSGYVLTAGNDALGFSLLINNYNAPAGELTPILDQIVLALVN